MRQYELTYLVSDSVKESEINKVTGKVGGFVGELGGQVLKEEIWKRRKLVYPIKKQEFAIYVTINLELPAEKVKEFERDLRLQPGVLRHLLLIRDYGAEKLTLTAEEIADTEAIEKAIGGEQSFEAVEGETGESKDLMAVRKNEEEKESKENKEEVEKIEEGVKDKEDKKDEKVVVKKKAKPAKTESEADRLAKLDKELDELLKEDL